MSDDIFSAVELFDDEDFAFRVKAGDTLFKQGDAPDNVYVMKSGTASVVIDGRVVETALRGTILGEMALIDPEPRAASVVANSDSEFFVIAAEHFEALIQKRPHFATLVMRMLVRRIRAANKIALKS